MSPLALILFAWAIVVVEFEPVAGVALALSATLVEFARLGGVGTEE